MKKIIKKITDEIKDTIKDSEKRNQFLRYVAVGLSSFAMEYAIFFIGYRIFGNDSYNVLGFSFAGEVLANSIATFIAFWVCFLLNRKWSFKSKAKLGKQLLEYLVLFVFNLFVTNFMIGFLHNRLGVPPELSKVGMMGVIVMWNFVIYRTIIYK